MFGLVEGGSLSLAALGHDRAHPIPRASEIQNTLRSDTELHKTSMENTGWYKLSTAPPPFPLYYLGAPALAQSAQEVTRPLGNSPKQQMYK